MKYLVPLHAMAKKTDFILENLLIESVAAEGKSIGHAPEGQVVFVEYAVPGDVVNVLIYKNKKTYMEGRIVEIVKPSEHRIEPFCSHFGTCGGCRWQHLPCLPNRHSGQLPHNLLLHWDNDTAGTPPAWSCSPQR